VPADRTATLPDGLTVSYRDTGGAGPALVFSHGFMLDSDMFEAQLAHFAPQWRCIAWDERGHGATGGAQAPFTYWDSARDLLALLDQLGVQRAVLVGMSQGGFLSLRAALLAPERVRALVLIDSQAGAEVPEMVEGYRAMAERWVTHGPTEELARAAGSVILAPEDLEVWVAKWVAQPRDRLQEPFATLVGRDDLTDRLAEISVPSLVVHGSADLAIPLQRASELAAGLPGCAGVHVVEGGAHASNVTDPAEVNAVVEAFLAGLGG